MIAEEKLYGIITTPLVLWLGLTFSAMFYIGSCSGKTLLLEKGLAVKLVNGLDRL